MILNPNLYKYALDQMKPDLIKAVLEEKSEKFHMVTMLSITSHIPLAVILSYILRPDVIGPNDRLQAILTSTIAFYQYEKLSNWDDLQ